MKLKKVLLRWYKSFHMNYRGNTDKGETNGYRPWNKMAPPYAPGEEFPFIEVPIENDITTIVGGNESGKSHLLAAISKVVRGVGIDKDDVFKLTDLCHYAGVRTKNVEAWPNIGLQFEINETEFKEINAALGNALPQSSISFPITIAIILAPEEGGNKYARLFVEPNDAANVLSETQLNIIRKFLPSVQFIDSHALLPSEIPLAQLIGACGDPCFATIGLHDRRAVEFAAKEMLSFTSLTEGQTVPQGFNAKLSEIQRHIKEVTRKVPDAQCLEKHLFSEILGISLDTLKYIYNLKIEDRGYIEGQIAKWNDAIVDCLNLAHFWRQDERFSLSINYKDGIVYFEIRDKTDSIYTFNERSSGLKFFLSYYIQAKAMEMSHRNKNSIILMDEPDAALSILGQRNLLAVFESLVSMETSSQTCQLIYSTHSPYLINRNFPRRIRVVKKEDAEEGTQFIEQARSRRYEPVRTALGIDSAPSLFLGADNILLEGATDQYLLTELIRIFATPKNVSEFLDLNAVVFVSANGVENVQNVLEQSRRADEPIPPTVIIVDNDKAAIENIAKITNKNLIDKRFVKPIGDLIKPLDTNQKIVTGEDIIPREIYVKAINNYIRKWMVETVEEQGKKIADCLSASTFGNTGLVAATKVLFREIKPGTEGDYDKMGILQEVIKCVAENPDGEDSKRLKQNVVTICDFIRAGLAKSRAMSTKLSATQAIKRIIHDFQRLNKDNVPVTNLERLFWRLESEVVPIGSDGESCLKMIHTYLAELEKLRSTGQERVVKNEWSQWKTRIDQIKANPLVAAELCCTADSKSGEQVQRNSQ